MKRRNFLYSIGYGLPGLSIASILPSGVHATENPPVNPDDRVPRFGDGRDWFYKKRFGMFIHWGLYSIPGWHEQYQYRGRIPRSEYAKLADQWNPTSFDPDKWLDLMEEAGMKYLTFTTKHIDGFCLWDTEQTSFNTMNTPYGRDVLRMISDACHRRDIPLCLYYSNVDNHHPNYPNNGRPHEIPRLPGDSPDLGRYIDFMRAQVTELCTNYGRIHGFWWDAIRWREDLDKDPGLNQLIRNLQPDAVINDRGFDEGDFGTPERDYRPDETLTFKRPTEACQSVGKESWGYRVNEDYYTDRHLMRSIDRYLTRDANYLLNVGPRADGTIDGKSVAILKRIGKWYNTVKESLEDVLPASSLTTNRELTLTRRDRTLYVHLNTELAVNAVRLKPLNVAPVSARLLNDGRKVDFKVRFSPSDHLVAGQKAYLNLVNLPVNELCNEVPVIKLEFDCSPDELVQPDSPMDGVLE